MDPFYTQLKTYGKVRCNESLAKHITYKIGGPAKYFVIVKDKFSLISSKISYSKLKLTIKIFCLIIFE